MKNSVIIYRSFYEALSELPSEDFATIFRAIIKYGLDDVEVDLPPHLKPFFTLIKPQIQANVQRHSNGKKGAEYGALGGRPKKNDTIIYNALPLDDENPNGVIYETPKEKEKEKEKENVDEKEKEKEKDIDIFTLSPPADGNTEPTLKKEITLFLEMVQHETGKIKLRSMDKATPGFKKLLKAGVTQEDFRRVVRNMMRSNFHTNSQWHYITPAFIVRPDKFDAYSDTVNVDVFDGFKWSEVKQELWQDFRKTVNEYITPNPVLVNMNRRITAYDILMLIREYDERKIKAAFAKMQQAEKTILEQGGRISAYELTKQIIEDRCTLNL